MPNLALKIHHPTSEILSFLEDIKYPWTTLSLDWLQRNAFMLRLENKEKTVGYLWFSQVPDCYKTYEISMAIHPDYQSRWMSRRLFKELYYVAQLLDIRLVLVCYKDSERLQKLSLFGFKIIEPFALLEIEYGKHF